LGIAAEHGYFLRYGFPFLHKCIFLGEVVASVYCFFL
jgi:hypothetical protein